MRIKFLVIAFLLANSIYSQSNFYKGFFISNDGIKTECFIKYTSPTSTPVVFEYKMNDGDPIQKMNFNDFKIAEIPGITKFVKATVEMDRYTKNINFIDTNREISLKSETHLLRVLQEGVYTLYIYEEKGLVRFFYSGKNSVIKELLYKKYYSDNTLTSLAENTTYKRQLWNDVKCENTKESEVQKLDLRQDDLEKYFEKANSCVSEGKAIVKYKKKDFGYINLKVSGLLNSTKLSDDKLGSKISVGLGAECEYVLPFNHSKFSIVLEPNYFGVNKLANQDVNGVNKTFETHLSIFDLPLGVRYCVYKDDEFRVFLGVSGSLIKSVYYTEKINSDYYQYNGLNAKQNSVGLGIGYKKFDLEFKYYIDPIDYGTPSVNQSSLIIRYSLLSSKKKNKE